MALTYSLDDFTVSFFVTGNGFSVLSVEVYAMARKGISMEINAISTILFLVIMLGILAYYLIQNTLKHKNIAKEVCNNETIFTINYNFNCCWRDLFTYKSKVHI